MGRYITLVAIALFLPLMSACSKTTIILLDNHKAHNAIDVKTETGKVMLDKPNTYTSLSAATAAPESVSIMDEAHISKKYKDTLDALPQKPVSILFYFKQGSSELIPESKAQVASLIELIKMREPCIVDIIGHSDTVGSAEKNFKLALMRAESLKVFLEKNKVVMKKVTVQSYGESDLLVPTADNVAEPKNRSVEVFVR